MNREESTRRYAHAVECKRFCRSAFAGLVDWLVNENGNRSEDWETAGAERFRMTTWHNAWNLELDIAKVDPDGGDPVFMGKIVVKIDVLGPEEAEFLRRIGRDE